MKVFKVDAYWIDEGSRRPFSALITSTNDPIDEFDTELTDDDIFYYGLDIPRQMSNGEFQVTDWVVVYEEQ